MRKKKKKKERKGEKCNRDGGMRGKGKREKRKARGDEIRLMRGLN